MDARHFSSFAAGASAYQPLKVGVQKSFPPLEGYGARCFAIVVRAKNLSSLWE
jgi:hypothetical protein